MTGERPRSTPTPTKAALLPPPMHTHDPVITQTHPLLSPHRRELFQKYEIYVDTLLNASDEILERHPPGNGRPPCAFSCGRIATTCCRKIFATPTIWSSTAPPSHLSKRDLGQALSKPAGILDVSRLPRQRLKAVAILVACDRRELHPGRGRSSSSAPTTRSIRCSSFGRRRRCRFLAILALRRHEMTAALACCRLEAALSAEASCSRSPSTLFYVGLAAITLADAAAIFFSMPMILSLLSGPDHWRAGAAPAMARHDRRVHRRHHRHQTRQQRLRAGLPHHARGDRLLCARPHARPGRSGPASRPWSWASTRIVAFLAFAAHARD